MKSQTAAMLAATLLCPAAFWLYDHGMLPSLPRDPTQFLMGWLPAALPLQDYVANPIWQLHGVRGSGIWLRSYKFACEFNTTEKVLLKDPGSWIKGTGTNTPRDLFDDPVSPDLTQQIEKLDSEFWFRGTYPSESTVLIHKKGTDHYYLFSAGTG